MDTRAKSRVWTRRQLNARGFESIYERMTDTLVRHNPLKFEKVGTAKDEYGGPIGALLPRLESIADARQLQFWLCDEFKKFFRALAPPAEQSYAEIASELWDEWIAFRENRKKAE